MSSLPQKLPYQLMLTQWAAQLNPVLQDPMNNNPSYLTVNLNNGVTTINHLLGRIPQGWFISDINGAAQIYRSQPLNTLTLTLTSNAAVTVNLVVY